MLQPPEGYPVDERINIWDNSDQALYKTGMIFKVPDSAPYEIVLTEIPRQDNPSSLICEASSGGGGDNYYATEDTWVDESNPTQNFYSSYIISCGRGDAGTGSWINRAYLKFNIAAMPETITSAVLRVNRTIGQQTPVVGVYACTTDVPISSITYNNQPDCEALPAATTQMIADQMGIYEWDITELVQEWRSGSRPNYGMVLKTDEVATNVAQNFDSLEGSGPDPVIVVSSTGAAFEEVSQATAPASGQIAINYPYGVARFHSSAAGQNVTFSYWSLKSIIWAHRVWCEVPESPTSPGHPESMAANANYFYKWAAGRWRRVAWDNTYN